MPGMNKPSHWIVLILVILLVFGSKKLPDLARSIGQSMKIFKKEIKELTEDEKPVSPANPTATGTPETTATPTEKREENA